MNHGFQGNIYSFLQKFADVAYEIRERYKVVFLLSQSCKERGYSFETEQRRRRLQHRMDYNADFIWTRNDDICQYLSKKEQKFIDILIVY